MKIVFSKEDVEKILLEEAGRIVKGHSDNKSESEIVIKSSYMSDVEVEILNKGLIDELQEV